MNLTQENMERGPFDPDELVRWAENYGHPEEWAKRAQALHAENERLRAATNRTMLAEFHEHPNCAPEDATLRVVLHREEHRELMEALEQLNAATNDTDLWGAQKKVARELADVVYVAYGTAHVHGIDLDGALSEVHRANMDKMDANQRRKDGKLVKPPGFVPPNMERAL